jgi:hypothetical protein
MPILRAVWVISRPKFSSVPAMFSAMTAAASLAEWVTSALMASDVLMVAPGFSPSLVGAWLAACCVTTRSVSTVSLPALR